MQPGQTITPQNETQESVTTSSQVPTQPQAITQPTTVQALPPAAQQEVAQFTNEVSWTASEYIAHDKSPSWFVLLGVGLFVLVGVGYFLTRSILATVLLAGAGLSFGIFAARPPRVLRYSVHDTGMTIGDKTFSFQEFKSFTVNDETAVPSLMLMPLKRFMPPITIFYDPQMEDTIINTLATHLPHEERSPDLVDRVMGRIRF